MIPELKLWSINGAGGVEPVSQLAQMTTELEFENLLVANPDMLEPGLQLVGRQTPVAGGWLDLLAVDGDGRLVVYELKRGQLARDAVTQILDYASALDAMTGTDLARHLAERSGTAGVEPIEDFAQWYADRFGGDDLSRLLPPRMVLIGLGVDAAAERIARFVSTGPVDLSVITFHGFHRDGETLLARQIDVSADDSEPRAHRGQGTVAERRAKLRAYLEAGDYEQLFDRVCGDIRAHLPEKGRSEAPRSKGISFALTLPDDPQQHRGVFGVHAGYLASGVYCVSMLPNAIEWAGDEALQRLQASVPLATWQHGGQVLSFQSVAEWEDRRTAVLGFLDAVRQGRDELRDGAAAAGADAADAA